MISRIWMMVLFAGAALSCAAAESPGEAQLQALARSFQGGAAAAPELAALIREAEGEQIPTAILLEKAKEGMAKRVPSEAILQACRNRFESLKKARALLRETGAPMALMERVALRLEAGMQGEGLRTILRRADPQCGGRFDAVLDAGEDLHLIGLDDVAVSTLMNHILDRNLGRGEIRRVVEITRQKYAEGLRGDALQRAIWGEAATTHRNNRGSGSGNGKGCARPGSGKNKPL